MAEIDASPIKRMVLVNVNGNPVYSGLATNGSTTVTRVASSATVVTLAAANSARAQLIINNASTAILYVKFGSGASSTLFTVQVPPSGYYELPVGAIYSGIVTGVWASVNGAAMVTELT